jgi:hypothetical protein
VLDAVELLGVDKEVHRHPGRYLVRRTADERVASDLPQVAPRKGPQLVTLYAADTKLAYFLTYRITQWMYKFPRPISGA